MTRGLEPHSRSLLTVHFSKSLHRPNNGAVRVNDAKIPAPSQPLVSLFRNLFFRRPTHAATTPSAWPCRPVAVSTFQGISASPCGPTRSRRTSVSCRRSLTAACPVGTRSASDTLSPDAVFPSSVHHYSRRFPAVKRMFLSDELCFHLQTFPPPPSGRSLTDVRRHGATGVPKYCLRQLLQPPLNPEFPSLGGASTWAIWRVAGPVSFARQPILFKKNDVAGGMLRRLAGARIKPSHGCG